MTKSSHSVWCFHSLWCLKVDVSKQIMLEVVDVLCTKVSEGGSSSLMSCDRVELSPVCPVRPGPGGRLELNPAWLCGFVGRVRRKFVVLIPPSQRLIPLSAAVCSATGTRSARLCSCWAAGWTDTSVTPSHHWRLQPSTLSQLHNLRSLRVSGTFGIDNRLFLFEPLRCGCESLRLLVGGW